LGYIAKQAVQKLAADSIRINPVLDFERKIIKLCKDLAKIRTDRDILLKEIRSLRRENREQRVSSQGGTVPLFVLEMHSFRLRGTHVLFEVLNEKIGLQP